ncbi:eukaryotic and archaeal DNA primase small subunit [Mycobacterium xenopi 3993]|nr:eukaryotic and archaeal DNA primase small subunit [Mycobacterium xenopi 3993]
MKLTNADKVLYPPAGRRRKAVTKAEVFDYYTSIAEVMVPHVAGRPATRKRWPNGVQAASFFEKQLASSAPDWLPRASVVHSSGTTTYPIIDTSTALAWIAQQAALEVHVPQWRFVAEWTRNGEELKPGPATRLVFDLDPGEGVTMRQLTDVARMIRDLIADIGLTTFPVTSGSKGIHIYAPLDKPVSSRGAVVLAKRVAQQLEKAMPKLVTATMTKSLRRARCSSTGARTTGRRRRSHRILCVAGHSRPWPRRAPGKNSTTPSFGNCATTRCCSGCPETVTCWRPLMPTSMWIDSPNTAVCGTRRKPRTGAQR